MVRPKWPRAVFLRWCAACARLTFLPAHSELPCLLTSVTAHTSSGAQQQEGILGCLWRRAAAHAEVTCISCCPRGRCPWRCSTADEGPGLLSSPAWPETSSWGGRDINMSRKFLQDDSLRTEGAAAVCLAHYLGIKQRQGGFVQLWNLRNKQMRSKIPL